METRRPWIDSTSLTAFRVGRAIELARDRAIRAQKSCGLATSNRSTATVPAGEPHKLGAMSFVTSSQSSH